MTERGEDVLGTVLDGRYRVEAVLGSGHAGGTVFRGRDATAGATVVVRCPAVPEGLEGEDLDAALNAFLDEAGLLAKVCQGSHEVERLLASGVAEHIGKTHVPFTVFEWLAGRSLERHLAERSGGASIGEALMILEPAARALTTAHGMGVAHRDVRPANLWLAEIGGRTTLKLAAFGLAARLGPGESAFAPEYGAPEHFKRSYGPIGPATDVYGLALVLIEMVTGQRALEGTDAGGLYLATSDLTRRPTLRAHGSHVSDAVEAVLQRALAVDPKRRWASARELWDALVGAVPELTPAAPSVRVRTSDRPPGVASATHPGLSRADSGPATTPPGLGPMVARSPAPVSVRLASVLAATPGTTPSLPPAAEDARLVDSLRLASVTGRSPKHARRAGADRSGTWAWLAVTALGLSAAGVVLAKVGGGASATPNASANASTSASTGASTGETVTLQPFLLDMAKVPTGMFVMGSDRDGRGERPAHRVILTHAFYIDRTEVRADAYSACVAEKKCAPNRVHTAEIVETAYGCNNEKDKPTHPANCIDRLQAQRYCAFVNKRLPTEAEWEYAARGTDNREFPWGNAPPTTCTRAILSGVTGPCGDRKGTWEVGTTAEGKSAFGALDMAGNVWEWVADGYETYPDTGDAGALLDPKIPVARGGRGILRGGSWDYAVVSAKVTYRLPFPPTSGNVSTGFRCARDAEGAAASP